jgi:hypothetical protein
MIIPIFGVKTLAEYLEKHEHAEVPRPEECSCCRKRDTFWRHGSFERLGNQIA